MVSVGLFWLLTSLLLEWLIVKFVLVPTLPGRWEAEVGIIGFAVIWNARMCLILLQHEDNKIRG
jgi:hypothetical protein